MRCIFSSRPGDPVSGEAVPVEKLRKEKMFRRLTLVQGSIGSIFYGSVHSAIADLTSIAKVLDGDSGLSKLLLS